MGVLKNCCMINAMTPDERKALLDLAKTWQAAADLHKKAMRRNRSFAQPGSQDAAFFQGEAAREEIRAELAEFHSKSLIDVVNQLSESSSEVNADLVSA